MATTKAEQVYTPILENRRKAERLRSTLGVFERSKFFFNLPGTLIEAIEAVRLSPMIVWPFSNPNLSFRMLKHYVIFFILPFDIGKI